MNPLRAKPLSFERALPKAAASLAAAGAGIPPDALVAAPPDVEAWRAVGDRLRRAAAGSK